MSISSIESPATLRALSRRDAESDEREAEVAYLRDEFIKACAECQADKFATFAPRVRNHVTGFTRLQTVGEVLHDELDYRDFTERAMQILLNAAAGRGAQRDAQQLIEDMATHFADMTAE